MTDLYKRLLKSILILMSWALFAACSAQNTLATSGNTINDGGTAEGVNGNAIFGEIGASGATLRGGNLEMTVVVGSSIGLDSLESGDMTISNSLGAMRYLDGWDE